MCGCAAAVGKTECNNIVFIKLMSPHLSQNKYLFQLAVRLGEKQQSMESVQLALRESIFISSEEARICKNVCDKELRKQGSMLTFFTPMSTFKCSSTVSSRLLIAKARNAARASG